ncbi:hypothetical protein [Polaribacter glomeratus]|uniref:Uncharacterized protein n=1 Tax=Polaribacter glomeratus TaxID=102 RepID=A0A2S7WYY9_9FLAO|nr:hypothetical protein [Polaribacter glomeratus]PQJ82783.1 hypothetical protein BTO16_09420 [Polaribacter glomeratus]TXD65325.1 hypothetical protein ESX12_10900 [Polaribacter glomeratus]
MKLNLIFLFSDFEIDKSFVVSICAIVVSIAGITIGLYYNWKNLKNTIEHNKKSVEPLVTLSAEVRDEKGHRLSLRNFGLGPAVLNSIDFVYEDKNYKSLIEIQTIHYLESVLAMDEKLSQSKIIIRGGVIGSGETSLVHKLIFKEEIKLDSFLNFLRKTKIKVEYSNLYGDTKVFEQSLMI